MQLVWKQTTARHLKGGKYEFLGEAKAGQSVFHLHLHLISGRPLNWPPG